MNNQKIAEKLVELAKSLISKEHNIVYVVQYENKKYLADMNKEVPNLEIAHMYDDEDEANRWATGRRGEKTNKWRLIKVNIDTHQTKDLPWVTPEEAQQWAEKQKKL